MLIYSKDVDPILSYDVDTRVYVRQSCGDEWTWTPWLSVETVHEKAAPYIGESVLVLGFDDTTQTSIGNYEIYNAAYLVNSYVKIETSTMYGDQPLWIGVITEKMTSNSISGIWDDDVEKYKALSIEILLSRISIDRSYTEDGTVNKVFTFNKDGNGNRSTAKSGGTFVFSSDGEDWTVYNILEYIVERFISPIGLDISLSGNLEVVQNITSTYVPLSNVLYVLNQLIDQNYGIGWKLNINSSDELSINIFSRSPSSIQTPIGTIPQNTLAFDLDISSLDSDDYEYSLSDIPKYEVIDVIGGPITVCYTALINNGLTEGWESADEDAYRTANGGSVSSRDSYRASYRSTYLDTFQKFVFDDTWDLGTWYTGEPVMIDCNPNTGELTPDSTSLFSFWDSGKSFNQFLPYKDNTDDENYKRPFFLESDGTNWVNRERLTETNPSLDNMYLHVDEDELAIYIEAEPNHLVNLDEDGSASSYSEIPCVVDYSDFYVTLALETDEVLRYTITSAYVTDVPKLKTVMLPNKYAWYIAPDTITSFSGVDNTDVSIVTSSGEFVRNDMNDLILVANLMFNWHVYSRSILNYVYNGIILGYPVGSIISNFETSSDIKPVNTPVIERFWRFSGGATSSTQIKTNTIEWDVE